MTETIRPPRPLLEAARDEIRALRARNAILEAKVETMELFASALHGRPGGSEPMGQAPDIAWHLDQLIAQMDAAEQSAAAETSAEG